MKKAVGALKELKKMLPYILVFNGAVILVSVILGVFYGFDWRVYSGVVVGNILMTANFLGIGITAEIIVKSKNFKKGQFLGNLSYGIRYIGMFVILAAFLTFGLINPISAVIPLFYPKIYYTFIFLNKDARQAGEKSSDARKPHNG